MLSGKAHLTFFSVPPENLVKSSPPVFVPKEGDFPERERQGHMEGREGGCRNMHRCANIQIQV